MDSSNLCDESKSVQCVQIYHKFGIEAFDSRLKMWFPLRLRLSWLWFAQNVGLILTSGWLKRWRKVSRLNVNVIECRLRS